MALFGCIVIFLIGCYLLFNGIALWVVSSVINSGWAGTMLNIIGGAFVYLACANAPFKIIFIS